MSDIYKTAIIGCGNRGKKHAIGLKADERCDVVALVDIKKQAAKKLNNKFKFEATIYEDYKNMLNKENIDIVVICLWTDLHFSVFRDCAEYGVEAIMEEKPIAPSWKESLEYKSVLNKNDCQLTFSHQRRFARGNILVRNWLKQGLFGEIKRMDLYSPPHLLDCGTHTIDQALSYNNEIEGKWVQGSLDTSDTISYFDVKAEKMAQGMIYFKNYVPAIIQVGMSDQEMESGVRITCEKGFIEVTWEGEIKNYRLYENPEWKPPDIVSCHNRQMKKLVKNTINSLEAKVEPELSYKKALNAAEIIFGLYKSAVYNQKIEFPLETSLKHPLNKIIDN